MRDAIGPHPAAAPGAIVVTIAAVGVLVFGPAQQAEAATGGVREAE